MGFQNVLSFQLRVTQDVDTTLPVRQKEQVAGVVPRDLVHFEVELFLSFDFVGSRVYESYEVFFIPHRYGVAVGRPRDVDVLALCVDGGDAFLDSGVPDAHWFVATGCTEEVGVGLVPAELVDGAAVVFEGDFLVLKFKSSVN